MSDNIVSKVARVNLLPIHGKKDPSKTYHKIQLTFVNGYVFEPDVFLTNEQVFIINQVTDDKTPTSDSQIDIHS